MADDAMLGSRNGILSGILNELGLVSLYHSPRDIKLLCLQRLVRCAAYSGSTLVLVTYLEALDISKTHIGLFMTLTIAGDVCISLLLTLFADGVGRQVILCLGAALMAGSGVAFALCGNYWGLLAAAVFGVISPSGNEIGPFRAVEESIVAHLTPRESRSDVYAWYSLVGTAGTAVGMVTAGWMVHHLLEDLAWDPIPAYRVVFYGYAALGLLKLVLALMLSSAVEAERRPRTSSTASTHGSIRAPGTVALAADAPSSQPNAATSEADESIHRELSTETTPLLPAPELPRKSRRIRRKLLPEFSPESTRVVISLCLLFGLDAFASGFAPLSWVTYFFRWKYGLEEGVLGTVFFVTSIIAAASMLVASSLAKRFGNINTMVFTHLPSSLFLALIPVRNEVHWSLVFLVLRSCTQSMDTAPRSAFIAGILIPSERTAIIGLTNIVKSLAQSLGPLITGVLADRGLFWVSFVCAGGLKIVYDIGILLVFGHHDGDKVEIQRDHSVEAEEDGSQAPGPPGVI